MHYIFLCKITHMHKCFLMHERPYAEIPISVRNVKASLDLHVIDKNGLEITTVWKILQLLY